MVTADYYDPNNVTYFLQSGVQNLLALMAGIDPTTSDLSSESGAYDLSAMATLLIFLLSRIEKLLSWPGTELTTLDWQQTISSCACLQKKLLYKTGCLKNLKYSKLMFILQGLILKEKFTKQDLEL